MLTTELLIEAYGRIRGIVRSVLKDVSAEALVFRPDPEANTIAWLVWHLARVQDAQIAELGGAEQVWTAGGWFDRFRLPFGARATGYGQSPSDVGKLSASPELLVGYYDAVHARSIDYLRTLTDADLERIVDASWNPSVTLAVRVVSILSDDLQHAGQAAYVRGIARRAGL